jgi:Ala-tRNA(Pro) deacylase
MCRVRYESREMSSERSSTCSRGIRPTFDHPLRTRGNRSTVNLNLNPEEIMSLKRLTEFLEHEHVKYSTLTHSPAFTAQEIAACAHVSGKELAKTVVVRVDGRLALAVAPADRRIALAELGKAAGDANARFASENEFKDSFPDCELGAMPPFGNLYGMEVYLAQPLTEDEEIAFNAGSHTELIKMPLHDFERLVKPKVANFTT